MKDAVSLPPTTIAQFDYGNRIISSVSFAILYYDFILTLPLEIERYWKSRISWGSVFFFLNRYVSILSHIPIVYEYFGEISESWAISTTMFSLSRPDEGGAHLYVEGCILVMSKSQGQHYAIAWSTILVFDFAVFCLTFARALKWSMAWRQGLFYLILRDGTMYFAILIVCYLSNVLTFVYAKASPGAAGYQGYPATLTNVLSATLVTRMMLNMREYGQAEVPRERASTIPLRVLRFGGDSKSSGQVSEV
ncbi:hypothetical protein C8Q76DRAFT_789289 [Earliella scabrosa]|nr:hypothetical protein C8Q76DRAFT_789289 [Earliella scabrosa]